MHEGGLAMHSITQQCMVAACSLHIYLLAPAALLATAVCCWALLILLIQKQFFEWS